MRLQIAALLAFFILAFAAEAPASAQACYPLPHAAEDHAALNSFWHVNIPLCQIPPGSNNAYANRSVGVVLADQDWLDQIARLHGPWAATGILAHEWGHMIQGNVFGTAAELQADCLAGVFMKGAGLGLPQVQQFARANFLAGDAEFSFGGHGLGFQRVNAAVRGYSGYDGNPFVPLLSICPLSAF